MTLNFRIMLIKNHSKSLFILSFVLLFFVTFSPSLVFAEPNPPIDLKANVISSAQIDLSWSIPDENNSSITGFKIEARVNTDPNYSVIMENTSNTDLEYSHTGLTPDTVYAYRVFTLDLDEVSEPSSSVTVKTSGTNSDNSDKNTEDSDVPSNVTLKVISPTSIELKWDPPTQTFGQTIQNYTIKQELVSGVYEDVVNVSSSDTEHMLSNLNSDKKYVFVVVANYALGSSDVSKEVKITLNSSSGTDDDESDTLTPDDVPDRPTDLEADVTSSTKIDLSWDAPDEDRNDNNAAVTGYKIEAKKVTDSRYDTVVEDTKSTSTKYSHTDLDEDTSYIYRIYAINSEGESDPSSEIQAKTLSSDDDESDTLTPDDVPDRPTDLEADVTSSTKIDLSWDAPDEDRNDNNAAVTGYKIEAKKVTDSRYDTVVEDTKSTSTKYSHTDLDEDTSYIYRIYAINSEGESDPSSEIQAKTLSSDDDESDTLTPDDVPDRPTDLEADVTSSTKIDLSWDAPDEDRNDNNAAVTGYKIEAKKVTDSRYDTVVEDTKSTSTKYSHTDLDEDTSYIYRIYAINSEGESDPSSEIQAKTLSSDDDESDTLTPDDVPDRPTDLEADVTSSTKIDLSWDAPDEDRNDNNAAVTGYKIECHKKSY